MEWQYIKDADITIGEKKLPIKKIAIISTIIFIILTIITIIFRTQVVDFVFNPTVTLKQEKVVIDIGAEFNAKEYVAVKNKRIKVEYPKSISTDKPLKTTIYYISKNSMRTTKVPLEIEVKDISAPKITLTENAVVLKRTDKDNFNPESYIKSVEDNYDKEVKAEFNKDLNFDKDKLEITYTAKDKAGNESHEILTVLIYGENEAKPTLPTPVKNTSTPAPVYTPPTKTANSNNNTNKSNISSRPSGPYINGVHNISVPVGTSPSAMAQKLIVGVQGSGYISTNYSTVNLQKPGTYSVTFKSSDGVSKTAYVTVTP